MIASTNYGEMEYTIKGKGPIVLYLHGGHSNCHETFGVDALVDRGFTLLVPSRPGYGKTSKTLGETPERFAISLLDFLDHLGVDKVHLIGVSAGAPSALVFASTFPERVSKIVLESAVTKDWMKEGEKLRKIAKVIFSPYTQHLTWPMVRLLSKLFPRYMVKLFIPNFSTLDVETVFENLTNKEVEEICLMNGRYSSGSGFMLDINHRIGSDVLRRIKNDTLIVHSRSDSAVGYEHALHASAEIPKAELFESAAWGHLIWLGREGLKVNDAVAEFLVR